jgi:PleD family two-component response regulator
MIAVIKQFIRGHKKGERIPREQSEQENRQDLGGVMPEEVFVKKVGRAISMGAPGCLILFEIDEPVQTGGETEAGSTDNVMTVLTRNFRKTDYFSQFKEDEYAVWLDGITMADEECIGRRVSAINDKLLHPHEGTASTTVSAGAAFGWSASDFRDLRKKAGKALYQVQVGGSCGCKVYEG